MGLDVLGAEHTVVCTVCTESKYNIVHVKHNLHIN